MSFIDKVRAWLAAPFDPQADAINWFLFTGLVVISTLLWHKILKQIAEVAT